MTDVATRRQEHGLAWRSSFHKFGRTAGGRRLERTLWVLAAILFHLDLLLGAYYLSERRGPAPSAIAVSLVEGTNPFLTAPQPGPPVVPLGRPDEPSAAREGPAEETPPPAVSTPPPTERTIGSAAAENVPPALDRRFDLGSSGAGVEPPVGPAVDASRLYVPAGPSDKGTVSGGPAGFGAAGSALSAAVSPARLYANRFGDRKVAAVERFRGTPGGVQAVADGLAWLAAHQDADGRWDRVGFVRHCPPDDRCGHQAISRLDRNADCGVTGLALLAFLGAGHLPDNPDDPYAQTVGRAIDWLVAQQRGRRHFGPLDHVVQADPENPRAPRIVKDPLLMYNQAIATLALAETFALTGRRGPQSPDAAAWNANRLIEPILASLDFLARTQQPEGGWDYGAAVTHRNDTSIAGWVVMAFKAAAGSGLPVPVQTLYRAAGHFARATDPDGRVWYADRGTGVYFDARTGLPRFRYGPAIVAEAVFSRLLLGYRTSSPAVLAGANWVLREPPNLASFRGGDSTGLHTEYYWYFGTLTMFQMGGPWWAAWNPLVQRAVLAARDVSVLPDGRRLHRYGSWPAYGSGWADSWGAQGGRVYATAINVLSLETPARYLPLNEVAADYDYSPVVEQLLAAATVAGRHGLFEWLGQLRPQVAEPVFYRLLKAEDKELRFRAAVQLAAGGCPLARKELVDQRNWLTPVDQLAAEQSLIRIGQTPVPDLFGPVLQTDWREGLVSFAVGNAFIGFGLPVAVVDDKGEPVVRMLVASFDRWERTAIGRVIDQDKGRTPRVCPGQSVKLHWN